MSARIQNTDSTSAIVLAAAAATLAFPPATGACGMVPAGWLTQGLVVPEFDLSIQSTGSLLFTAGELFAGIPRTLVYGATAMTSASSATDAITKVAHGLLTGDGAMFFTTTGTLPGGLALATGYYVIKVDADTFKVALTLADALAGTAIDLTTNGTGVLTMTGAAGKRVYWHSYGLLPSSITLTNQRAYSVRCAHRPRAVAYAVCGTLSAGTVDIAIEPVFEG